MKDDNRLIWINGEIKPVDDAKINVLAPTSQFGANVFEGIRCYWNAKEKQLYGFRLADHYERLEKSIRMLRMKVPYTMRDCMEYMKATVRANGYREDIAVRQTIFVDGFGSWFSMEPCGMFIAPISKKRAESPLVKGESVLVTSWERISERDLPPKAKVGANYINSRLAKLEAQDKGYDAALFLNREGTVSEGTGSCFFMVKNDTLITPTLEDSILESITRDTIMKLAREEMGIKVVERHIAPDELGECDEAFFCGSAVEVTPIIRINSYDIGNQKPGEITRAIHREYLSIVDGTNKKYANWVTPIYE